MLRPCGEEAEKYMVGGGGVINYSRCNGGFYVPNYDKEVRQRNDTRIAFRYEKRAALLCTIGG